ncbi:MAG: type III secretion system stator protein SctL [Myxococcota bacterium]
MSDELPKILRADAVADLVVTPLVERRAVVVRRRVIEELEDADAVRRAAEHDAQEILERAEREAEEVRERARAAGFEQGISEIASALASARAEYDRLVSAAEGDMVELAVGIAERIVGAHIERHEDAMAEIVASHLDRVQGRRRVTVRVHPDDVAALERARAALQARIEGAALVFEPEDSIARGGCVVETESGRADARLEVQLDVFRRALMQEGSDE